MIFSECLLQAPIEDSNFPGFCNGTNDMIHVGDADGRKDLVCRKNKGERYQIALTGESISILFCLMVGFCL